MSRKKVTLTIDSTMLAWAKTTCVNISRLLDGAILLHRERMERNFGVNSKKNDGLVVIRTRDLRRVKATS